MSKRVLVTGAAGFIGFHLCKHLKQRGDAVFGYDNFNNYYSTRLKFVREKELEKIGVIIEHADICQFEKLKETTEKHSITHIAHLAAQAGVRYSLENPQLYVKTNIEGFVNILELCKLFPHIKLTYASSSSVYGLNEKIPFSEQDRTDHPASPYGATKKAKELLASSYHHLFGISAIGLRYFTVYGPWGRPDMAYYTFTDAIYRRNPIYVYNGGQMLRDFTFIDDAIQATLAAIDLEDVSEPVLNVGGHRPVALMDFIHTIENATGKKAECIFLPHQKGDMTATYADITNSKEKLNFSPKTTIAEGIDQFVKWFKSYHSDALQSQDI